MKKPARPKKPVRKTPKAPKHVARPPHKAAHPQQHHGQPNPKMKGTPARPGTPKHPKAAHHKRRQLALGEGVACCAAEALAASLRLAGWPVDDEDVLKLHRLAGGTTDEGLPIATALEAAREFGLAGVQLADIWNVDSSPVPGSILGLELPGGPHALTLDPSGLVWSWGGLYDPAALGAGLIEEAWLVDWELSR